MLSACICLYTSTDVRGERVSVSVQDCAGEVLLSGAPASLLLHCSLPSASSQSSPAHAPGRRATPLPQPSSVSLLADTVAQPYRSHLPRAPTAFASHTFSPPHPPPHARQVSAPLGLGLSLSFSVSVAQITPQPLRPPIHP